MRSSRSRLELLNDILESIDAIGDFMTGMDFGAYVHSKLVSAAVERKLLIISEAAVRLGKAIEADCPTQDWRAIWGIGNNIRHHYEGVDHEVVWDTVKENLPSLRADVARMVRQLTG